MTINEGPTRASKFGEWLFGKWRSYLIVEKKTIEDLIQKGTPVVLALCVKLAARLALMLVVMALISGAFLVVWCMYAVSKRGHGPITGDGEWAIGEQYDERNDPSYDPINFSHTADPRFDDD